MQDQQHGGREAKDRTAPHAHRAPSADCAACAAARCTPQPKAQPAHSVQRDLPVLAVLTGHAHLGSSSMPNAERSQPNHGTSLTRGQQPRSPTAQHPRCGCGLSAVLAILGPIPLLHPQPPSQHQTGRRRRLCLSSAAFQAVDRHGEARRRHGDARGGEDRRVRYGPLDPSEGPGQHRRLAR